MSGGRFHACPKTGFAALRHDSFLRRGAKSMGDGDEFEFSSTRPAEDLFVCSCCIDDADIKNFIESEVCVLSCDFCGKVSQAGPIAAPLEDVVRFMLEAVEREYDKAVNALGWESAEGGYQGSHW